MAEEEKISVPKRRRNKDDGELDITPMIGCNVFAAGVFCRGIQNGPSGSG